MIQRLIHSSKRALHEGGVVVRAFVCETTRVIGWLQGGETTRGFTLIEPWPYEPVKVNVQTTGMFPVSGHRAVRLVSNDRVSSA